MAPSVREGVRSARAGHTQGEMVSNSPAARTAPQKTVTSEPPRYTVRASTPEVPRPVGSTISTTRRRPDSSRSQCATRWTDAATAGCTNPASMLRPASRGSAQSLPSASRAELAWIVAAPGTPVLRARTRSSASASRTSPTTSRSGRIRSASFTSRRSETSPVPSRLGCRPCSATMSGASTASSNVSSTVTMRWWLGAAAISALSRVVLPA